MAFSFKDFAATATVIEETRLKSSFGLLLYNEPGVDKFVDLKLEVLRDDRVVGSVSIKAVEVEEGESSARRCFVTLPISEIDDEQVLTLRITMVVSSSE